MVFFLLNKGLEVSDCAVFWTSSLDRLSLFGRFARFHEKVLGSVVWLIFWCILHLLHGHYWSRRCGGSLSCRWCTWRTPTPCLSTSWFVALYVFLDLLQTNIRQNLLLEFMFIKEIRWVDQLCSMESDSFGSWVPRQDDWACQ